MDRNFAGFSTKIGDIQYVQVPLSTSSCPSELIECQLQYVLAEAAPKQCFRSKEGFVLIYDCTSLQSLCAVLQQLQQIYAERQIPNSVVWLLGNRRQPTGEYRYETSLMLEKCWDLHQKNCYGCLGVKKCSKFLVTNCNLLTGCDLQQDLKQFA